MQKHSFPEDFLWGASTASHQVEGNTHNQWSEWEKKKASELAATAASRLSWLPSWPTIKNDANNPENYISGNGIEHFTRYKQDFTLLSNLGMNAFRFGIEWSRIEPLPGEWNHDAIQHYKRYIAELKAQGITPVLTLWHWTMPVWFTDLGGFEKKQNLRYFERYAQKIAEVFGQDLTYFITLNEPNVYAALSYGAGEWPPQKKAPLLGLRVYCNLMRAHKSAYKLLRQANPAAQIGVAAQLANMQPLSRRNPFTRLATNLKSYFWNWWFLDRIKDYQDFIGLNYYFTEYVNWNGQAKNPKGPLSDLGWYMEPQGIAPLLKATWKRYKTPVIITENGLADSEDKQRRWWIEETIIALKDALQSGVGLKGYLHWSLLDNFEWAYGWWPKFGLIAVDRKTMQRSIRQSAKYLAEEIKRYRKPSA